MAKVVNFTGEQTLRYRGAEEGFVRVDKSAQRPARNICAVRKTGETDERYAARLEEAMQRNRSRHPDFWRQYGPKEADFLQGFYAARQRKRICDASRNFDAACFDGDLNAAFKGLRGIQEYFKSRRTQDLDCQAISLLKAAAIIPNHGFAENPVRGYADFIYESLDTLVKALPDAWSKLGAMEDVFTRREELHLQKIDLRRPPFMKDNSGCPARMLDWGDPAQILQHMTQSNSRFLEFGLSHACKLFEAWNRERGDNPGTALSHRFGRKAGNSEDGPLPARLRKVIAENAQGDHPQAAIFAVALDKIDKIRDAQLSDLDREIERLQRQRREISEFWEGKPKL